MNQERKREIRRKRITENKTWLRSYKEAYGCCRRCIRTYHPEVMQFHHVYFPKIANVSDMVCDGYSLHSIKEEIKKCELICANCHALQNALEREAVGASEAA
jgi:hypothetical protein